jgi:hypothetical protein
MMRLLGAVCLGLWTAFVIVITLMLSAPAPQPVRLDLGTVTMTPQEDEPGWDCHTMGNRVCGP